MCFLLNIFSPQLVEVCGAEAVCVEEPPCPECSASQVTNALLNILKSFLPLFGDLQFLLLNLQIFFSSAHLTSYKFHDRVISSPNCLVSFHISLFQFFDILNMVLGFV